MSSLTYTFFSDKPLGGLPQLSARVPKSLCNGMRGSEPSMMTAWSVPSIVTLAASLGQTDTLLAHFQSVIPLPLFPCSIPPSLPFPFLTLRKWAHFFCWQIAIEIGGSWRTLWRSGGSASCGGARRPWWFEDCRIAHFQRRLSVHCERFVLYCLNPQFCLQVIAWLLQWSVEGVAIQGIGCIWVDALGGCLGCNSEEWLHVVGCIGWLHWFHVSASSSCYPMLAIPICTSTFEQQLSEPQHLQ